MAEPFSWSKFFDFSPTALGKVFSIFLKITLFGLLGLGVWIWVKPHFTKPLPTTGITGNVETLNQDCSEQVCKAIVDTEKRIKQKEPWIKIRLWKIATIGLGGT